MTGPEKFCEVCGGANPADAILCAGCHADLTFIQVRSAPAAMAGPAEKLCANGHPMEPADELCLECGSPVAGDVEIPRTVRCGPHEIPLPANLAECPLVEISPGEVVRIFPHSPDAGLAARLAEIDLPQVAKLIETGRDPAVGVWFQRWEQIPDATPDAESAESLACDLTAGISALHAAKILLRDLSPESLGRREEGTFAIRDLTAAVVADIGLSSEQIRRLPRFAAPEAAVGVFEEASDWWSLGMILLGTLRPAAVAGLDRAFLLHVITRGADIPDDLPELWETPLKGLLTRDPARRWSGRELLRWLDGERGIPVFFEKDRVSSSTGPALDLAGQPCHTPEQWALVAASADAWAEALDQFERGALATWLGEISVETAAVDRLRLDEALTPDERLACALVFLNPRLPLVWQGEIVNPAWLLGHAETALRWLEGELQARLRRLDRVGWLVRLRDRRERAEALARDAGIALDQDHFRAASLVADDRRLLQRWTERRRDLPVARNRPLAALAEKPEPLPEELLVLLAARPEQFILAETILQEATTEATAASAEFFDAAAAVPWFDFSHREILRALGGRLDGFTRCDDPKLDEWADEFRLERRLPLARALILLQVPPERWRVPLEQDYQRDLFGFFHRRILRGIQRGPLLALRVSKNSRNLNLSEFGGPQLPATALLDRLISRQHRPSALDPAAFETVPALENRLRRLHREAVDYQRTTGIEALHLGFPILAFRPRASSVAAKPKRAPLFLWPIELDAPGGRSATVKIGFDHDRAGGGADLGIELNPALTTLLSTAECDALHDALAEALGRAHLDAAGFYELCAAALPQMARQPAELIPFPREHSEMAYGSGLLLPAAAIFLCDFSQQTIAEDIRAIQHRPLALGALSRMLRLGGPETPVQVSADGVAGEWFVLNADPSQRRAVRHGRDDAGLVIQGPPGTGKSQTIVNILADCMGRGERALLVCQKHAALEVVARRLAEQGLSERFMMIQDARRSREPMVKSLREQTAADAPWRSPAPADSRAEIAARIETLERQLDAAPAAARAVAGGGLTYLEIIDRLIDRLETAAVPAFALRGDLAEPGWETVRGLAVDLGALAGLWISSDFFKNPWRGLADLTPDAATLAALGQAFDRWAAADEARMEIIAKAGGRLFSLADVEGFRRWIAENRPLLERATDAELAELGTWGEILSREAHSSQIAVELDAIRTGALEMVRPPAHHELGPRAMALPAARLDRLSRDSQRTRAETGWRLFLPGSVLGRRRLGAFGGPPEHVHAQLEWETARRIWLGRLANVAAALAEPAPPDNAETHFITDTAAALTRRFERVREISRAFGACPLAGEIRSATRAESLAGFLAAGEISVACIDAANASAFALDGLAPFFPAEWIEEKRRQILAGESLAALISQLRAALPKVAALLEFRARFLQFDATGQRLFERLEEFRADLAANPGPGVAATLEREALLGWKARAETACPELRMGAAEFATKVANLREAADSLRVSTARALRRPRSGGVIQNATSWMNLLMLRGARARKMREILDDGAGYGLFDLRPVWLASPETVSRVFPLKPNFFDVVIFDEASQMPVEMAIPALFRARRVIVSGDRKQLPPTNFFRTRTDDADENDEEMDFDADPDDAARDRQNRREVKDCADLLDLAEGELPDTLLGIHYRSQWRHLIAYPNHAFYEARLSVPVHHPDSRIREHRPLDVRRIGTPYEAQINEGEAAAVVDSLAGHWRAPDAPSLGVVTFNLKQAERIEELIDARMAADEVFRADCERERTRSGPEAFFVRNLENVQGDERDWILFSTTFGPDAKGRFIRNFGPLGQRGGERRLNVAVTRARAKMIVFTSLPIAEIAAGPPGSGTAPREALKAWLAYAEAVSEGNFDSAAAILTRSRGDAGDSRGDRSIFDKPAETRSFVREVADCLRAAGHDPQPGTASDAFHFDLAIADPATGSYRLAIECDPPLHPDLDQARAREIWRPAVMSGTIPKLIRLNARAWYEDPDGEKRRLFEAIKP